MVLILLFAPSIGPRLIGWPYQVKSSRWLSWGSPSFLGFWSRKPLPFQRSFHESHRPSVRLVPKHSELFLAAKGHKQRPDYRKHLPNKPLLHSGLAPMFGHFENIHRVRFELKSGFRSIYVRYVLQNSRNECLTSDIGTVYTEIRYVHFLTSGWVTKVWFDAWSQ